MTNASGGKYYPTRGCHFEKVPSPSYHGGCLASKRHNFRAYTWFASVLHSCICLSKPKGPCEPVVSIPRTRIAFSGQSCPIICKKFDNLAKLLTVCNEILPCDCLFRQMRWCHLHLDFLVIAVRTNLSWTSSSLGLLLWREKLCITGDWCRVRITLFQIHSL